MTIDKTTKLLLAAIALGLLLNAFRPQVSPVFAQSDPSKLLELDGAIAVAPGNGKDHDRVYVLRHGFIHAYEGMELASRGVQPVAP